MADAHRSPRSFRPLLVPLAIFLGVLVSRLPFATHNLWAWDSVLYARALEQGFHVGFNLTDQRPHAPGYIFYVGAAALARLVTLDSNAALVTLSIFAGALGAAAIYLVTRRFAGTGVAVFAAVAYGANPLVWTYSEVAYPYAVLATLSVTLAGLFWLSRMSPRRALIASLCFGLLAGFRQDILLLLGPLWLWMMWPAGWRVRLVAAALAAAGVLAWLVPTAALSGGLGEYLGALASQADSVRTSYSVPARGLSALSYNVRFTLYALAWGLLGFGAILAGLALGRAIRAVRDRQLGLNDERTFFLCWIVPGVSFYSAVHIGEWGYVLSVLPAFYVLTGALLGGPAAALRGDPRTWRALAASVALAPAVGFLLGGSQFSATALSHQDRALDARVAYVRAHFPVDQTIVLAREDYLTIRYYLPEFRTWFYDPPPYTQTLTRKRAMHATTIVLFTDGLTPPATSEMHRVEVLPGVGVTWIAVQPGDEVTFQRERFSVREWP